MSASGIVLPNLSERERRIQEARRLIHVATVSLHGGKPKQAEEALAQALAILRGLP